MSFMIRRKNWEIVKVENYIDVSFGYPGVDRCVIYYRNIKNNKLTTKHIDGHWKGIIKI